MHLVSVEPSPLELDPRPCGLCGLTIDRHDMVDDGDGPIFYCPDLSPDELTLPELERRAELIRQVEVAEIFARLEAMDDPSKRLPPRSEPEPYRPAGSTIAAFLHLARHDRGRLAAWLANHPQDVRGELFKLWESKS